MDQRKKNITLLVILGLLVFSSLALLLTDHPELNTIENRKIFSVRDTSVVDHISIYSESEVVDLKRVDGTWILNNKYRAEQNIARILLSILKDMEVTRNVASSREQEIMELIREQGFRVRVESDGEEINEFYTSGNANKTITYIMPADESEVSIINIPGYESYVAGIFEITSNDWRDRTLLRTNWRTLQLLEINYHEFPEYNVKIKFDFDFLNVEGVNNLDTARMMAFLDEFNYLQADRYIDQGQIPRYDSLMQTPKTVSISVQDINKENSKAIDFFPIIADDPMMLGYVQEDDQMVLFQASRIQKLFAVKSDFEAKAD